ncbi:hypothetical protein ES707_18578 [subsurface metagenome]
MKLRCFLCVNEGWARKGMILTLRDIENFTIVHGLNPLKIENRSGSHGLGFYYGSTCIAQARILSGELRTDVADSSCEKPLLVLENGAHLGPEELDGYTIVQAKGSEMIWARGAEEK